MKKLHVAILSLFLTTMGISTVHSQDPPTPPVEGVASVGTFTGVLQKASFKHVQGDDRPLSSYLLVSENQAEVIQILLPHNSPLQDEIISQTFDACVQQGVLGTFSGTLVTHTNSFGSRTSLIIRQIEVDTPEQTVIITWHKLR